MNMKKVVTRPMDTSIVPNWRNAPIPRTKPVLFLLRQLLPTPVLSISSAMKEEDATTNLFASGEKEGCGLQTSGRQTLGEGRLVCSFRTWTAITISPKDAWHRAKVACPRLGLTCRPMGLSWRRSLDLTCNRSSFLR